MSTWDNSLWDVDDWDADTVEQLVLLLERTPNRTVIDGANMSVNPLDIKVGNTRPWQFTLKDDTGGAVSLAGTAVTVKVYMRARGANTNTIDGRAGTVTNTDNGVWIFSPASTEVATAGTYDLEVELTDGVGQVQRNFSNVMVVIRNKL